MVGHKKVKREKKGHYKGKGRVKAGERIREKGTKNRIKDRKMGEHKKRME